MTRLRLVRNLTLGAPPTNLLETETTLLQHLPSALPPILFLRRRDASHVLAPRTPAWLSVLLVEFVQRLVVREDELIAIPAVVPPLPVQHLIHRQPGLDVHVLGRVRPADRHSDQGERAPWQAKQLCHLAGVVPDGSYVAEAQAERLGGRPNVLRGERSVHGRHDEHVHLVEPRTGPVVPLADGGEPAQVRAEDEEQRRLADEVLVARNGRQRALALGVLNGDGAPCLHHRGCGGALARGDQRLEGAGPEGVGQEPPNGFVSQQGFDDRSGGEIKAGWTIAAVSLCEKGCVFAHCGPVVGDFP